MKIKKEVVDDIASYGPYNTYSYANGFLFISGQLGIKENTKCDKLYSIEQETYLSLTNINKILIYNNMNLHNILKITIFITDIKLLKQVNNIYSNFFIKNDFPAREVVQVVSLPMNANIEISAIAYKTAS